MKLIAGEKPETLRDPVPEPVSSDVSVISADQGSGDVDVKSERDDKSSNPDKKSVLGK